MKILKKLMKRHGKAENVVTDRFALYRAALKELDATERQQAGRWLNNRVENSHLPFRRSERAIQRFRRMRSLQKFTSVHSSVYNHFNQERSLTSRDTFKPARNAALAEWRQLCSGKVRACRSEQRLVRICLTVLLRHRRRSPARAVPPWQRSSFASNLAFIIGAVIPAQRLDHL